MIFRTTATAYYNLLNHRLMVRRSLFMPFILMVCTTTKAQMLFSENLTMNIDSTKTIQGSLQPDLDFKTEKEKVLTVKNTANLNVLI